MVFNTHFHGFCRIAEKRMCLNSASLRRNVKSIKNLLRQQLTDNFN